MKWGLWLDTVRAGLGALARLDWGRALGTGVGAQRGLSFGTKSGSKSELRAGA